MLIAELGRVFALCFGLHLFKLVDLSEPAPAFLFIASEEEVSEGFLLDEAAAFYRRLHETGAFYPALETTLAKRMTVMNCQKLFLEALAHYVRTQCQGEARRARLERMVTRLIAEWGFENPAAHDLGRARRQVRVALEPGDKLIAHFAPRFLVGRPASFSYREVQLLVRERYPRR
ncbi:hypothetical protein G5B46_14730 [Caulobacter sp. 602-2]|uniref:Uncharacterized protein n=1 Tax=Caulobacter sp. 602-2 TaxID=2710887 RepID=A0A6G4QYY6_9CAUL|nr:hypothetical protein [Caulobacter sp. 602-2]NGM50866.1 hypothetical protein [Caulobacter sp. 602-2]